MKEKPKIRLALLAEESLGRTIGFYRREALESEYHKYFFTSTLSDLKRSRAIVFLCPANEPLSPLRKECLLFASRFGLPLFVLWLHCGKLNGKNQLANEEVALRQTLFASGFDGDSATIIRFYAGFTEDNCPRLLAALDANESLLQHQPKSPAPLSETLPDSLAKLLLALDELRSSGAELSFSRADPFEQAPSTKMGGMPYLETGEEWPSCPSCKAALKFLWQVDASNLLSTESPIGLYVFYLCDSAAHQESFSIRRYENPSIEKMRAPAKEAEAPLRRTGAPMYSGYISDYGYPPHYHDYVPSSEMLKSQKSIKGLLSTFTRSKKDEIRALRQELLATAQATEKATFLENVLTLLPAKETKSTKGHCFRVGGYFVREGMNPFGEECACKRCNKRMQTLTLIRVNNDWRFSPLDEYLFLVCPCTPDDVVIHSWPRKPV